MKNKNLFNIEFATLSFFLINSFLVNIGISLLTRNNNSDSCIDIIIGGVLIILFLFLVLWIRNYYKKDIIDTIYSFKYLKYPLLIIILIILFISTIYSLNNLISFIHYYILKEASIFTISITIIPTILYLVSKNIPTITRISSICFYIYLFIFIIGFIGLYKYIDISNLKPIFISSINQHIKTGFMFFNYSILPVFLLLGLKNEENKKSDNKEIIIFIVISIITIFLETILVISTLGINLTNIYTNPDIIVYKKISFLNIFERLEVLLSFNNLLNSIFLITINIYLIKKIIILFLKKKKELTVLTLIGLSLVFLSSTITISKNIYLTINNILFIIIIVLLIRTIIYKYIHYLQDRP